MIAKTCLALPCLVYFYTFKYHPEKSHCIVPGTALIQEKAFPEKERAHFLRRGPRAFTGDCISPRMQMYLLYSEVLLKSGVKSEKNLRTAATCSESLEA